MPTFLPATVTERFEWAPGLFSLRLDRVVPFQAGQFLSLSSVEASTRRTRRAYSVASAPGEPLEFLVVEIPGGAVSPLLHDTRPGDAIYVSDQGKGLFTLDAVPGDQDLWMVGTGTGFAPYRSMLREGSVFEQFERIIVLYGVRERVHLAYWDELRELASTYPERLHLQAVISRESPGPGSLPGRITDRLADNSLETRVGAAITRASHVMLCGNPAMIAEMMEQLSRRGLHRHTRREPGQITTEKYW